MGGGSGEGGRRGKGKGRRGGLTVSEAAARELPAIRSHRLANRSCLRSEREKKRGTEGESEEKRERESE